MDIPKIAKRLSHVPDIAIHPSFFQEEMELYRARIISAFLMINLLFYTSFNLLLIVVRSIPQGRLSASHLYLSIAMLMYLSLLVILRRTKNLLVFGHSITALLFFTVAGASIISGAAESSILYLLAIIIAISFLFTDVMGAVCWTILVFITDQLILSIDPALAAEWNYLNPDYDPFFDRIAQTILYAVSFFASVSFLSITRSLIAQIRAERRHFRIGAEIDQLTQLGNRRAFNSLMKQFTQSGSDSPETFALLYFDLNEFKPINDNYGHDAGDALLEIIGLRIQERIRRDDRAFRLGGDEFGVIFRGIQKVDQLVPAAKHLISVITEPVEFEQNSLAVGVSCGAVIFPRHSYDPDELVTLADQAMYEAKKKKIQLYIHPLQEKLDQLRTPENEK